MIRELLETLDFLTKENTLKMGQTQRLGCKLTYVGLFQPKTMCFNTLVQIQYKRFRVDLTKLLGSTSFDPTLG